jgi:hypothetical protein
MIQIYVAFLESQYLLDNQLVFIGIYYIELGYVLSK